MSKPSDGHHLLAALALLAPLLAVGGIVGAPERPSSTEAPPAPGLYQIRCWQHGRLVFEDRITLPGDAAAYSIRLSGTDRYGKPMYVAETRNATCLVRHMAPESW